MDLANWTFRTSQTFATGVKYQIHQGFLPDLAPSDFHLFLHLKRFLSGQRFHNDRETEMSVTQWFQSQAADFYDTGYKSWSHGMTNFSILEVNSGGSSYRDKGMIPTNKFKLIKFLFYFQNLISLTLLCVKFHFCYIICRLFIIHHYIKFSINVAKYCSHAVPLTLDWWGQPHFKGLLLVSYITLACNLV